MILAQAVLQIFCLQCSIGLQCKRRKRGITLQWQVWWKRKKIQVCLFFMLIPCIKFQDPISNGPWPYSSVTDGQAQTNMPPQFWGHNKIMCTKQRAGRASSVGCASARYVDGHGFDPYIRQHSFLETGHEIISTAILSFRWFMKGVVVSYWWKTVHKVLVNCLGGLPWNSVVRLTDLESVEGL